MRKTFVVATVFMMTLVAVGFVLITSLRDPSITIRSLSLWTPTSYAEQRDIGFKPRLDIAPWVMKLPLEWDADPFHDRNWQFQLSAWRMIDPILDQYGSTGDPGYLTEAMTYVRDWYRYHVVDEKSGAFSWYDMATGLRAIRLAFLEQEASSGRWSVGLDDKRILTELAEIHVKRLRDPKFIKRNNHGLFQTVGLDMLCQTFASIRGCGGETRKFAAAMFEKIAGDQFTNAGIHRENSPQYHRFALGSIEDVDGAERFDLPSLRKKLDRAHKVWPYLVLPDRTIVQVGDSDGTLDNPLSQPDADAVSLASGKKYSVRDWSESGYIVVRSNPPADTSMLFVTGTADVITHKHADNLSFVLFEHGRQIFVDGGKYAYNPSPLRDHLMSAAAHNTISLMEKPQSPRDVKLGKSSLLPLNTESDRFVISGRVEYPGLGFVQERQIEYKPEVSMKIEDTVIATETKEFVSSLLFAPDLLPDVKDKGFSLALPDGKKIVGHVEQPGCRVDSVRGQENPPLGWVSQNYLEKKPATVVRAICSGKNLNITWQINLDASSS